MLSEPLYLKIRSWCGICSNYCSCCILQTIEFYIHLHGAFYAKARTVCKLHLSGWGLLMPASDF